MARAEAGRAWPYRVLAGLGVALLLSSCGSVLEPQDSAPSRRIDASRIPDAVPRAEPRSRYGNPVSYQVHGRTYQVWDSGTGYLERGTASWYGTKFHGRRTSSGEPYDMYAMTAAHKNLPLPTYARVTNLENGRSVVVKINDRGPFHEGRIIDLSYAAASKLGYANKGTARVEVEALHPDVPPAPVRRTATQTVELPPPDTHALQNISMAAAPAAGDVVFLQIAAFRDLDNAQRLVAEVIDRTQTQVRIVRRPFEDGELYKIQLGPVADGADTEALRRELEALGYRPHRAD